MAPPPSMGKRPSQVKRASVGSNMSSVASKKTSPTLTPKELINEALPRFSFEELQDVIRIAQRHLKAKYQERRAAAVQDGRRTWRFWDRPLSMDWSETGIPKLQYPRGRAYTDSKVEIGWSPFEMLVGMGRPPMEVDWSIFEMLSPTSKTMEEVDWDVLAMMSPKASEKQVSMFAGDDVDEVVEDLEIDWSDNRLPCFGKSSIFSVRRRRRRVVDHRRGRPSPPSASDVAGTPTDTPPAVVKRITVRAEPPPRASLWARRVAPRQRIQQPGGGAAHVRGAGRRM